MKVLQVNAVYRVDSTGSIVLEIHQYLKMHGDESYVACADSKGDAEVFVIGSKLEKKMHAIMSRLSGKQAYFSRKGTRQLINYIKKIDPDVVHLHNLHSNYINFPMLLQYLAQKDIATVLTLHDCWFYTGKCVHYYMDNCMKWRQLCGKCPRLRKDNVSYWLDRTTTVLADKRKLYNAIPRLGIIGVSDWIIEEAKLSILNCSKKMERVYNWVDLEVFNPGQDIESTDKTIILAVAMGWKREKGLYDIIEVSKRLRDDEQIVMIGNIKEEVKLPSNILHIAATTNQEELAEFYRKATVLLNLSWMESFGKVSAEALACGTPIICYNTTASPELVGENCGYVVEKGDFGEVCDKIRMIKGNKQRYRTKCVEFARTNFSKNANLSKIVKFYKDICGYEG